MKMSLTKKMTTIPQRKKNIKRTTAKETLDYNTGVYVVIKAEEIQYKDTQQEGSMVKTWRNNLATEVNGAKKYNLQKIKLLKT